VKMDSSHRWTPRRLTSGTSGITLIKLLMTIIPMIAVGVIVIAVVFRTVQRQESNAEGAALEVAEHGLRNAVLQMARLRDSGQPLAVDGLDTKGYVQVGGSTTQASSRWDTYCSVEVRENDDTWTVVSTGRAVVPGGNVNNHRHVLGERTAEGVISKSQ